jgi:hypothetical protein
MKGGGRRRQAELAAGGPADSTGEARMRTVGFILLLLAAWCVPAWGDVLNIGWDDAPSRGGTPNRLFDCDANDGSNALVVTFVPPVDLLGITELKASVFVESGEIATCSKWCDSPPLQPWWDLRPGTTRAGAIAASADFQREPWASSTTVEDPWAGCTSLALYYRVQTTYSYWGGALDSSQVGYQDVDITPSFGRTVDLLAGHEYYVVHATIRNTHTVGAGAAPGCCAPARIGAALCVASATTVLDYPIAVTGMPVAWNGWRYGSCPGVVPARVSTWGALKSRYR